MSTQFHPFFVFVSSQGSGDTVEMCISSPLMSIIELAILAVTFTGWVHGFCGVMSKSTQDKAQQVEGSCLQRPQLKVSSDRLWNRQVQSR